MWMCMRALSVNDDDDLIIGVCVPAKTTHSIGIASVHMHVSNRPIAVVAEAASPSTWQQRIDWELSLFQRKLLFSFFGLLVAKKINDQCQLKCVAERKQQIDKKCANGIPEPNQRFHVNSSHKNKISNSKPLSKFWFIVFNWNCNRRRWQTGEFKHTNTCALSISAAEKHFKHQIEQPAQRQQQQRQ